MFSPQPHWLLCAHNLETTGTMPLARAELSVWVLLETSKSHGTVLGLNGRITKFRKLKSGL